MNTSHKKLMHEAMRLTNLSYLDCNLYVNRRNGYYAIDKYDLENGKFLGPMFVGNYKECETFLMGMFLSYLHTRPF